MGLQFTDEEIKEGLSETLIHSDKATITRETGIGTTIVKENFNPESPRTSHAYSMLRIACALADIDEGRGDRFMEKIVGYYEVSKRRKRQLETNTEVARFAARASDVAIASIQGRPNIDLFEKIQATERQLRIAKSAVMDDIRDETRGLLTPPHLLLMQVGQEGK